MEPNLNNEEITNLDSTAQDDKEQTNTTPNTADESNALKRNVTNKERLAAMKKLDKFDPLEKDRIHLILLLTLGCFGAHDFYRKKNSQGVLKFILAILTITFCVGTILSAFNSLSFMIMFAALTVISGCLLSALLVSDFIDNLSNDKKKENKLSSIINLLIGGLFGSLDIYKGNKVYFIKKASLVFISFILLVIALFVNNVVASNILFIIMGIFMYIDLILIVRDLIAVCKNDYGKTKNYLGAFMCFFGGIFGIHHIFMKDYVKFVIHVVLIFFISIFVGLAYGISKAPYIAASIITAILLLVLEIAIIFDFASLVKHRYAKYFIFNIYDNNK